MKEHILVSQEGYLIVFNLRMTIYGKKHDNILISRDQKHLISKILKIWLGQNSYLLMQFWPFYCKISNPVYYSHILPSYHILMVKAIQREKYNPQQLEQQPELPWPNWQYRKAPKKLLGKSRAIVRFLLVGYSSILKNFIKMVQCSSIENHQDPTT